MKVKIIPALILSTAMLAVLMSNIHVANAQDLIKIPLYTESGKIVGNATYAIRHLSESPLPLYDPLFFGTYLVVDFNLLYEEWDRYRGTTFYAYFNSSPPTIKPPKVPIAGGVIHEEGWRGYTIETEWGEGVRALTLPMDPISNFDLKTGDVFYIANTVDRSYWSLAEEGGIPGVPEWAGYQKFTVPPLSYDVFVDDVDAVFEGTWGGPSTAKSGYYGTGYRYRWAGTGSNTATWTFNIPQAGSWEVFARWSTGNNRASDAPYTINHADGSATIRVNQQNSGSWYSLGVYSFNEGTASVVLSDDADNVVIADAIKLVQKGITVDDMDADLVGSWGSSTTVPGYYGTGYRYHWAGSGSNTATWLFYVPQAGSWEVFARWTSGSNRATDAPYTINHAGGSSTVRVNQENNGGEWVSLGTYDFNEVVASIELSDGADDVVIADAVMLVKTEVPSPPPPSPEGDILVDDSEASYVGNWDKSSIDFGYYGNGYRYHTAGSGSNTVTWSFYIPIIGSYEVFTRWTNGNSQATNAPYTVKYAEGSTTVLVNQENNGGTWYSLGVFSFGKGEASVVLSDDVDADVIADAIMLVQKSFIMDDVDADFVGYWGSSTTVPGYYGTGYRYRWDGSGSNTATWSFNIPDAGKWKVYGWWTSDSNRASDTYYTVYHANGRTYVPANQKINGGKWNSLGTFNFNEGMARIVVSDRTDDVVIVDAVMLVNVEELPPLLPTDIVIKSADASYLGGWGISGAIRYHESGTGSATATWDTNLPVAGKWEVFTRWQNEYPYDPVGNLLATNAPYTISHSEGSTTVRVNQEKFGYIWQSLGVYDFEEGGASVVLSDDADDRVIAWDVRFVYGVSSLPEIIVDDSEAIFTGAWGGPSTVVPGYYGEGYRYRWWGGGSSTATWSFSIPQAGLWQVYARWTSGSNRAMNAPYRIKGATIRMNQRFDGGEWVNLGLFNFNVGESSIQLSEISSSTVIADAVKLVKIG